MMTKQEYDEYLDDHEAEIAASVRLCMERRFGPEQMKAKLSAKEQKVPENKYFLTFTVDPVKGNSKIRTELGKIANRKTITFLKGAVEHVNTNLHVHMLVLYSMHQRLRLTNFNKYQRDVGKVDLKRVHKDNGISAYFDKENGFSNYQELDVFLKTVEGIE